MEIRVGYRIEIVTYQPTPTLLFSTRTRVATATG
jgi:hypothetical protein